MAALFRLSGVSLNLKDPFFDYFWSGAFKFGYQSAQDAHFFKVVYSEMKCKVGGRDLTWNQLLMQQLQDFTPNSIQKSWDFTGMFWSQSEICRFNRRCSDK